MGPQLPLVSSLRWMCRVMSETLTPCPFFRLLHSCPEKVGILAGSLTQASAE